MVAPLAVVANVGAVLVVDVATAVAVVVVVLCITHPQTHTPRTVRATCTAPALHTGRRAQVCSEQSGARVVVARGVARGEVLTRVVARVDVLDAGLALLVVLAVEVEALVLVVVDVLDELVVVDDVVVETEVVVDVDVGVDVVVEVVVVVVVRHRPHPSLSYTAKVRWCSCNVASLPAWSENSKHFLSLPRHWNDRHGAPCSAHLEAHSRSVQTSASLLYAASEVAAAGPPLNPTLGTAKPSRVSLAHTAHVVRVLVDVVVDVLVVVRRRGRGCASVVRLGSFRPRRWPVLVASAGGRVALTLDQPPFVAGQHGVGPDRLHVELPAQPVPARHRGGYRRVRRDSETSGT